MSLRGSKWGLFPISIARLIAVAAQLDIECCKDPKLCVGTKIMPIRLLVNQATWKSELWGIHSRS
jgi:hypothetical protein